MLNAAAVTKPHAIEHVSDDLIGYNVGIAAMSETHMKVKHQDQYAAIEGNSLFRRDRRARRGGVRSQPTSFFNVDPD